MRRERRFRLTVCLSKTSEDGRHALSLGLRVGYWPCLKAPFVSAHLGRYRIDVWHGLASYAYAEPMIAWPR